MAAAVAASDKVDVIRYSVDVEIRYRGTFKEYIYASAEYGVEIHPGDAHNPIRAYDASAWKGMSNKRATVKVKRGTLEACKAFLAAREQVVNALQMELSVGE